MEDWRYDNGAVIGLIAGLIAYMLWSWVGPFNGPIGGALVHLAGTTVAGGSLGCATVFVQRRAAARANDRQEKKRLLRISLDHDLDALS